MSGDMQRIAGEALRLLDDTISALEETGAEDKAAAAREALTGLMFEYQIKRSSYEN